MSSFTQRLSLVLIGIVMSAGFVTPSLAQPLPPGAQITDEQLGISYGAATGLAATDVRVTTARIIRVIISMLGVVALVIMLIAGFTWMTAGGNEEKVGEAKKWMAAGVIGLAIILTAYSITTFVIGSLVDATTQGYYNFR